jgi:predicted HicB family RNase H-like nuclease
MGNKKAVNVKVDEELWRKARSIASLEGKPVSQWLEEVIKLELSEKHSK